ncbi:hypothetical protein BDZ45DRAFT_739757 [Acephala macrosclerotiorum]|nr:hypothetical protein BDZ45DRAFT_739757 [Acephala macrosclerotiorum]
MSNNTYHRSHGPDRSGHKRNDNLEDRGYGNGAGRSIHNPPSNSHQRVEYVIFNMRTYSRAAGHPSMFLSPTHSTQPSAMLRVVAAPQQFRLTNDNPDYAYYNSSVFCRIPIDSGLIFSFASSVLVSGREQLLL